MSGPGSWGQRAHRVPHRSYDAVVIGAGMAGLTAATRLAQAGRTVLVLEKNTWVGGYAHGFSQDGFHWDHGGHIFLAYRLGAQAREVFERLRLDEAVEMRPIRQNYRCVFPDDALTIPDDLASAAEAFTERFPAEGEGIRRVLATMEAMIGQVDRYVPAFRVSDGRRRLIDPVLEQVQRPLLGSTMGALAAKLPLPGRALLRYQRRTLADLLDDNLRDPRLKAYFSMLSAGIGTGPRTLSAVIAGVFFIHALRTMWLPLGGFNRLALRTAELCERYGGEVRTGCEVTRLLVEDGRVTGVETGEGDLIRAKVVISASDARRTLLEMLEPGMVPQRLRECLPKLALTPSIFQVHLGVNLDLAPYRDRLERLNFVYPHDDIERAMGHFAAGDYRQAAYFAYVATLHQREMAPLGGHSLKLEAYTTLESAGIDWKRDADDIADSFIVRTERLIPGLSRRIVTRAIRTPEDLAADTGNSQGAFAGWAFTPELVSRARPPQRRVAPGLYLAGHWTTPAAGVPWVMLSGFNTANAVLVELAGQGSASIPGQARPEVSR